ncbi:MAG: DUF1152 domain-containing protein [Euryarchaeota archaeon]|nr:DUF1152 domain-containing protein [Euryarchaeota archaeon]
MNLDEIAGRAERALVIGIGGGGDVIGCIPTASYLSLLGVEVVLGGLTWERRVVDPKPGPRRIEELENAEKLCEGAALAGPETRTIYGTALTESVASRVLGREVLLLDISGGALGTAKALEDAGRKLGIDLVVGIDVGGDSLARGDEPGVQSPLADGIMLAALAKLPGDSVLGVIGYGSDGELTLEELNRNVAELIARGALLGARGATQEDLEIMERIASASATEASRLVVEAGRGRYGEYSIRAGRRSVYLTPCSLVTFYFSARQVFDFSRISRLVAHTSSLREADRILRKHGYLTELYFEEGADAAGQAGEQR